ncbi:MAG: hypothetical protein AAFP82_12440, partial [Bacteroidota bacterium]
LSAKIIFNTHIFLCDCHNKSIDQWEFSKSNFYVQDRHLMPSVISVTTNAILERMDDISASYARLTAKYGIDTSTKSGLGKLVKF